MQENEADPLPRPTVPTTPPPPVPSTAVPRAAATRRRKPEEAAAPASSRQADGVAAAAGDETRYADDDPDGTGPVVHGPPPDLFADQPQLQRLRDRWHSLPRWEDMTMEERREAFGYSGNPPEATGSGPDTPPPALE